MKVIKLVWLWLLFGLAITVSTVQAADIKIGVVNAAMVLDKSPQKTQALARLEKEFLSRSKSLEKKHKTLRAKQDKLIKDGAVMGATERQDAERKILSEQRDLKRLQDEYGEDLSIRRNEELRKLEQKIAKTIVDLAKKESYDLVVYQGVIYASERVDLTEKVLAILKKSGK